MCFLYTNIQILMNKKQSCWNKEDKEEVVQYAFIAGWQVNCSWQDENVHDWCVDMGI